MWPDLKQSNKRLLLLDGAEHVNGVPRFMIYDVVAPTREQQTFLCLFS